MIDCKEIAKDVLIEARELGEGMAPSFVAFVVAPSSATRSYLTIKKRQADAAGISMNVREFPESVTTEELVGALDEVQEDAVIVQLPLPNHVEMMRVLEAIPAEKDADVLSPRARMEGPVMHPIAASVNEILTREGVEVRGARAAVVGQGWLVGRPVADWLNSCGADVSVITLNEGSLEDLKSAQIIVAGAGSPGIITRDVVAPGAVVIDVGTSELGGSIAGDVDPLVATVAGFLSPVPGGVGPIAVAFLMKNVATLSRLRRGL